MKGISQVVSAVVILAVSISLVSIYAGWAPGFAESIVGDIAEQTDNQIKCDNAAIDVENAEYDRTGELLEFEIENTGSIRLSNGLQAGAFRSSSEMNRTTIAELEVGETHHVNIIANEVPDSVLVTSNDCPSIKRRIENIDVSR